MPLWFSFLLVFTISCWNMSTSERMRSCAKWKKKKKNKKKEKKQKNKTLVCSFRGTIRTYQNENSQEEKYIFLEWIENLRMRNCELNKSNIKTSNSTTSQCAL